MMGKYLNVGNAGFASARKGLYVDKTGLIARISQTLGTKDKLTCVSRPRRFGKSYAAQMLCAYYDRSCDSAPLFEGLRISEDESFRTYLNRYDVIYLDITGFISKAFINGTIKNIVRDIQSGVVDELAAAYPEADRLEDLPEMLYQISQTAGQKFMFIIDEWDALFREVKDDSFLLESYIQLLRGLFKDSGKTDHMIEAAYMTGILPIKKYGSQSAVSDFIEYNMIDAEPLEEYVGFTEAEVGELCAAYGIAFEDVRKWYDGYRLGNGVHIYNPKSVVEAVKRKRIRNYWTRTETYESLKLYIELNEDGLQEAVVQLLGGAHIRIDVSTFQNDMTTINSRDDVLTLLVHLGYLAYESGTESVFIPNEEVRAEFVRSLATGRHRTVAKLIQNSDMLLKQTLGMDEAAVAAAIEEAHKSSAAPLTYNNEESLRSTIRFAYISCVDEFVKIEELPSGHGYADVVFFPKKGSSMPVILIELKWNKTDVGAIRQMKNRDYPDVLKSYGGELLLVGINYDEKNKKHTCRIEKYRKNESGGEG